MAVKGEWPCISLRLTSSMIILVFLAASCAAPRRWQRLTGTPSDAQRVSILRQQAAEGDATLADVLNREGDPDTVNLVDYSQSASLRLDYTTPRKRYVLESSDNKPWQLVKTEVISSLPRYRDTDTVDAYSEYLRRFPDDPPEDLEFARNRIKHIDEEREKEEKRAVALAELEQFIRTHPRGHDIGQVYRALEGRSQLEAKNEFETTQAHHERVAAARTRPVLGPLTMDAPLVFEVQKQSLRYDADAQRLEIVLKFGPVWNGMTLDRNAESLPSRFRERNRGSYMATNAFGAVVDVSTSSVESYALVVKNVASLPTREEMPEFLRDSYERARRSDLEMRRLGIQIDTANTYESSQERFLSTTLSLGSEDAKRAKENLRVFAISRLAPPFISKGEVYSPAKFDSPSEFYETVYYVHVEVLALWFYDLGTARVIARING